VGREFARYAVALVGGVFAGARAIEAVQSWRQYRTWSERDPSGAAAYLTFAQVDVAVAVITVVMAGLVWWLLGPASTPRLR